MVIVDEDFEERFEFSLGFLDDLDFGEDLESHFLTTKDTKEHKGKEINSTRSKVATFPFR